MDLPSEPQPHPRHQEILARLRRLAELSKELENNARMQAAAVNLVQAGELKRRVEELTRKQESMVLSLVELHPDPRRREDFASLSRRIEAFQPEIRACQDPTRLAELKREIDASVEEWVHRFQGIVSNLMGVDPPSGPV